MTPPTASVWIEENRAYLLGEFDRLRAVLAAASGDSSSETYGESAMMSARPSDRGQLWNSGRAPAIEQLAETFGLVGFESDLLLLAAGIEMDSNLGELCARLSGKQRSCLTFGLALSVLPHPEWNALSPWSPLRRYRLVDIEAGHGLATAPLRIDERILHFLAGINRLDPRLEGVLRLRQPVPFMASEHAALVEKSLRFESGFDSRASFSDDREPIGLHFYGDDASAQENIAAHIAGRLGRHLYVLNAEDGPAAGPELEQFLALWSRESLLLPAFLLLQWRGEKPGPAARALAERLPAPLIVASRDPQTLHRMVWRQEVNKPDPPGQRSLWQHALAKEEEGVETSRAAVESSPPGANATAHSRLMAARVDCIAEQFRLSAETIASVAHAAMAAGNDPDARGLPDRLWESCRAVSRAQLDQLAERIVPRAGWRDLILPDAQMLVLRMLVGEAQNRMIVYEQWGFARRGRRGLGLSALFSGPSGTGKTLAAEVLANDLELDLYRIDLSAVVSKYIGETEKNLSQVFDAAEQGGVVLLFDEADALFGKRSEVKDSHDRYANIEVGYLLQRMETYQGVAILTTNSKALLDKAFQRRLRFTVDFPFPGIRERQAIWERTIPEQTPADNLDRARLAQLNMTGGSIRNIALNAAFLAAAEGNPMAMTHVLTAAQLEAGKEERPIAEIETRGWV